MAINDKLAFFKKSMDGMIATSTKAYQSNPDLANPIDAEYTLDDVRAAIQAGDPNELIALSEYFYRASGIYARIINYYSSLLTYDTIIVPKLIGKRNPNKVKLEKAFFEACNFLDVLDVPTTFNRITNTMFMSGASYGLLREYPSGGVAFHELSGKYCRTRFRNEFNMNKLEFDLKFFDDIREQVIRDEMLASFPREFQKAYNQYRKNYNMRWYLVPDELGAAFYYIDKAPMLVSSLPAIMNYDFAQEREAVRDEQELQKLLVQELTMPEEDADMEYELAEAEEIHRGTVNMLKNMNGIDVLTTFAKVTLHDVQDTAQATQDRLAKFKRAAFDGIGTTQLLFNAEGNIALKESINKDIALMHNLSRMYASFLTYHLNTRFATPQFKFEVEILPISIHNRDAVIKQYMQGAQYGFSKMYAGVAMGIKQSHMTDLMYLENDLLALHDKMVPLQSSHTSSGNESNGNSSPKDEKSQQKNNPNDITDEGGRPKQDDSDITDKTIQNKNSQ